MGMIRKKNKQEFFLRYTLEQGAGKTIMENVKVLLVDDENDFVETLAERLELRGFSTTVCYDGEEAIRIVKDAPVDVVILDVQMPGLDGISTLREIKQLVPLIEVIMLTGHATVQTAIDGMKLGAYDYIMKPVENENLVDKMNKAYARKMEQEERISQAEIENIVKTKGW